MPWLFFHPLGPWLIYFYLEPAKPPGWLTFLPRLANSCLSVLPLMFPFSQNQFNDSLSTFTFFPLTLTLPQPFRNPYLDPSRYRNLSRMAALRWLLAAALCVAVAAKSKQWTKDNVSVRSRQISKKFKNLTFLNRAGFSIPSRKTYPGFQRVPPPGSLTDYKYISICVNGTAANGLIPKEGESREVQNQRMLGPVIRKPGAGKCWSRVLGKKACDDYHDQVAVGRYANKVNTTGWVCTWYGRLPYTNR